MAKGKAGDVAEVETPVSKFDDPNKYINFDQAAEIACFASGETCRKFVGRFNAAHPDDPIPVFQRADSRLLFTTVAGIRRLMRPARLAPSGAVEGEESKNGSGDFKRINPPTSAAPAKRKRGRPRKVPA